ncbi:MAG: sugar phosphate nucleotidyltransferase [Anaerolineales bacterium]|jgi:glucose-1-phosphate adenylyltransferase
MSDIENILAVIMGGGIGKRLFPLTKERAKPAVPIAGKYRLIDITISNCINSGINRIAVLTQFNSVSLHRHITQTYRFDSFHRGWVQILAAEQTPLSMDWYQGTADAVRKQLFEIKSTGASYVLILAGDHLYRMDYRSLMEFHHEHSAEITVAVQPVSRQDAPRFGLLKREPDCRITAFVEKPREPEILEEFISREDPELPYLGSMGIYLFNTDALIQILEDSTFHDFGSQIIPNALTKHQVYGFSFAGFWEDIGTIRSFYETNLMLTDPDSPFNFTDPTLPIYTRPRFLPGSVIDGASLENVLLADGCKIYSAEIKRSVVGLRSRIADGVFMQNTIMMGADYFDPTDTPPAAGVPLGIGPNSHIEGAILDKDVRIGESVTIKSFPLGTEVKDGNWVVKDGIVVIPKKSILPKGTYIGPE